MQERLERVHKDKWSGAAGADFGQGGGGQQAGHQDHLPEPDLDPQIFEIALRPQPEGVLQRGRDYQGLPDHPPAGLPSGQCGSHRLCLAHAAGLFVEGRKRVHPIDPQEIPAGGRVSLFFAAICLDYFLDQQHTDVLLQLALRQRGADLDDRRRRARPVLAGAPQPKIRAAHRGRQDQAAGEPFQTGVLHFPGGQPADLQVCDADEGEQGSCAGADEQDHY